MTIDLPDVNVLTALHLSGHPHKLIAREWFDQADSVATTPITQSGLLRMVFNPTLNAHPDPASAKLALSALLAAPGVVVWPDDTRNLAETPFMYALTGYGQVTDLHLLAIAASHNARLVTLDTRIEAALRPADRKHLLVLRS
ncbi:MAG: PIN domain-containing protein [Propionibacteriaceae bacterium]|nr:PIN domain-containing protein [Propionibacteriaceae bacterium]